MERRLNPTTSDQDFSVMAETFYRQQAADASAFFAAPAPAPGNHDQPLIPYQSPLELNFNGLSLTSPSPSPSPLPSTAAPPVNGAGRGSIFRGNSSMDMSHLNFGFSYAAAGPQLQFSNEDLQRMRIESAAREQMGLGLFMQRENLEFANYGLGNTYNYRRTNRNGFRSPYDDHQMAYGSLLNNWININNANLHHRASSINGIVLESNSSSSSLNSSDWPAGYTSPSRSCRMNFSCLEDLRGKFFLVATDKNGCRFLENKFIEKKPEEIHMIFLEIKDHISELMIHPFGNIFIQKFFEFCSSEQMTQLLLVLINDQRGLKDICVNIHGTRSMQKMIEHLTTSDQSSMLVSVLKHITFPLTRSSNGNHVIQHCLKFFTTEDNKHILNVAADNCLDIATDKNGCCVLQRCIDHAHGEPGERLIAEITSNALILAEHPYGNYVVQYLVCLRIPRISAKIITQLSGHYVSLSMNKYGSHVVEKCLNSQVDEVIQIIDEIVQSSNFLRVLQDPYGNYVAQFALKHSKGPIRHAMENLILVNYACLHSHPHGKQVLACIKGRR